MLVNWWIVAFVRCEDQSAGCSVTFEVPPQLFSVLLCMSIVKSKIANYSL